MLQAHFGCCVTGAGIACFCGANFSISSCLFCFLIKSRVYYPDDVMDVRESVMTQGSVAGKTLGVVLVGLVGLLAFIGVLAVSAVGFQDVSRVAQHIGLGLAALLMIGTVLLAVGQGD